MAVRFSAPEHGADDGTRAHVFEIVQSFGCNTLTATSIISDTVSGLALPDQGLAANGNLNITKQPGNPLAVTTINMPTSNCVDEMLVIAGFKVKGEGTADPGRGKELLAQAEAEDEPYGADQPGDELPEEAQRRETRLKRIREAQRALEERVRQKAEAKGKPAAEGKKAKPASKDQYNFTNPEGRMMKSGDGFVQGCNAQAAVESALQLIVGQSVTAAAEPMVQVIEEQSGQWPKGLLADSGYCSEKNLGHLETGDESGHKIDAYIATGKQKHGEYRPRALLHSFADQIFNNRIVRALESTYNRVFLGRAPGFRSSSSLPSRVSIDSDEFARTARIAPWYLKR